MFKSISSALVAMSLGLLAATLLASPARADDEAASPGGRTVQLPHVFPDAMGSNWDVQFDGSIADGGDDLYDGGGRLFVNAANQYVSPTQQATLDPARNELCFPPVAIDGLNVSRRVAVLAARSTVRFTEVLENPTAGPLRVQLRCYFNMGQAVQRTIPLVESNASGEPCGYAVADPNNAVAMVYCGRGAKARPRFAARFNDDNVDIVYDVTVPARETVAVVHFQMRGRSAEQAAESWAGAKEGDLLTGLPKELRRRVVNFPAADPFLGDLEILRGGALDVVELRGGDAYRGTLKVDAFRLQTVYGPVTLPASRVMAMLNVGRFRASQLVVTRDGEVFGGRLDVDSIPFEMTGGHVTNLPLSQVTRLGYRRLPGEPEEWNFEGRSVAYLRSGERILIRRPTADLVLATPAGPITLDPGVVASVLFEGGQNAVPEVHLTDGSRLSAIVPAGSFDVSLGGPCRVMGQQRARFPTAAMLRFTFAPERDVDPLAATVALTNGDRLVGTIGGTVSLETPFDTIHVEGEQVRALAHARERGSDHDVRVTMWDGATLSGRLVESHVTCLLRCGVRLRVPVGLVSAYDQPLPLPSPRVVREIQSAVRQLDAGEWPRREAAQRRILAIGPPVIGVLRRLHQPTASTEAAQRIELIVERLRRQLTDGGGHGGLAADGPSDSMPVAPVVPMLR